MAKKKIKQNQKYKKNRYEERRCTINKMKLNNIEICGDK